MPCEAMALTLKFFGYFFPDAINGCNAVGLYPNTIESVMHIQVGLDKLDNQLVRVVCSIQISSYGKPFLDGLRGKVLWHVTHRGVLCCFERLHDLICGYPSHP